MRNVGEKGLPVVGGMYKHDAPLKPRYHPSCTFASDEVPSTSVLNIILNCKKSRQGEQKRRKARTHQIFVVNAQKVRHIGIRYLVVFIITFRHETNETMQEFWGGYVYRHYAFCEAEKLRANPGCGHDTLKASAWQQRRSSGRSPRSPRSSPGARRGRPCRPR
jgi:hypothetical protein